VTDKEEPTCIVCITVQFGQWNPDCVTEGCIVKNCSRCGIDVYVSKSGQKMMEGNGQVFLTCINCLQKFLEEEKQKGEPVKFGQIPGAIEEAIDHIKKLDE
jgi:hypothetical protein